MHAGLSSPTLNRKYIQLVRRELLPVIAASCASTAGCADTNAPVCEEEIEFVWNLHGGMFYQAMRRHVYRTRINMDFMTHVAFAVDTFLAGAAVDATRAAAGVRAEGAALRARASSSACG